MVIQEEKQRAGAFESALQSETGAFAITGSERQMKNQLYCGTEEIG